MNPLTLTEIKQIELQILKTFKSFCDEHGIRYFLSNGTLLGAVKYKGFIPWDDDIDVFVPREDYQRLLSMFQDDEVYHLFAFEKDPDFLFPFAKLCDMTTYKDEEGMNNGVGLGLDIDIFPLDSWGDDFSAAVREMEYIHKNMFYLNLTKLNKADSLHPLKRAVKSVVMVLVKSLGSRYYLRKIIRKSSGNGSDNPVYLGCKTWCIYKDREIIPAEVFDKTIEMEFEGERFSVPAGYDTYLRSLYGDYEQDPPSEKQKTHHHFTAYRVGNTAGE